MSVDKIVRRLNVLLKLDPDSITDLFLNRVEPNEGIVDSNLVVVYSEKEDNYRLGPLGILNGFLTNEGLGKIALIKNTSTGKIIKFEYHPDKETENAD